MMVMLIIDNDDKDYNKSSSLPLPEAPYTILSDIPIPSDAYIPIAVLYE